MKLPHLFCIIGAVAFLCPPARSAETDFYVGTYTHWYGSKGIYHFQFDDRTGQIRGGELAANVSDPSYVVIAGNRRRLYAVNERKVGVINAYAIASNRQLQLLDRQSSHGAGPCHLSFDQGDHHLLVANYFAGTVAVLPVQRDGALAPASGFDQQEGGGVNKQRQEGPHAHSIYVDPADRFVYSCDLGNDKVEGYRYNAAAGTLARDGQATARIAPGSGPRHLVLHPRGFVYVVNEMASTVTVLRRDESTGAMHTLQTVSTLPKGFSKFSTCAEIALHPNGEFLYASNRGHDSIAVFALGQNGRAIPVDYTPTGGRTPRHFAIDPSGRWLLAANQDSNDIFVFRVNARTGRLTPTGQRVRVGSPVCVAFVPPR